MEGIHPWLQNGVAEKWTIVSRRLKDEGGITMMDTALSLTTSAEEYLTGFLHSGDELYQTARGHTGGRGDPPLPLPLVECAQQCSP